MVTNSAKTVGELADASSHLDSNSNHDSNAPAKRIRLEGDDASVTNASLERSGAHVDEPRELASARVALDENVQIEMRKLDECVLYIHMANEEITSVSHSPM